MSSKLQLFLDKYTTEFKNRFVERQDIDELNKIIDEVVSYFESKLELVKWKVTEELVDNLWK